jgi:uncharacterized membrane protein
MEEHMDVTKEPARQKSWVIKWDPIIAALADHKTYLLAAVLLGGAIRFIGLDAQSFWLDELWTTVSSSEQSLYQLLTKWVIPDGVHPPLHNILLFYWFKLFGDTEISARLPSAIAGVLSIVAIYHFSKPFCSRYIATSAAILVALTYEGIYYSQEARSYSLLILFSIIATFLWLRIVARATAPVTADYLKYGAVIIPLAYTHYFGLLLVAFQLAYWFGLTVLKKERIKPVVITAGSLILAYAPWVFVMIATFQDKGGGHFWIQKPGLTVFIEYAGWIFYPKVVIGLVAIVFLLVVPPLLSPRRFVDNLRIELNLKEPRFLLIPLIYLSLAIPAAGLILSQHTPLLTPRNLFVISPIVYLLIAIWISASDRLAGFRQNLYVLLICGICFILLSPHYYSPHKDQWREAVKYAAGKFNQSSIFIIPNYKWGLEYYLKKATTLRDAVILEKGRETMAAVYTEAKNLGKKNLILLELEGDAFRDDDIKFLAGRATLRAGIKLKGASVYEYALE